MQNFYSIVDRSVVDHIPTKSVNDSFAHAGKDRAPKPADSARQWEALQELKGILDGLEKTQGRRPIVLGDVVREFLKVFDRLELPENRHQGLGE